MPNELLTVALLAWLAAAFLALTGRGLLVARGLLVLGCAVGIVAALLALPDATGAIVLPTMLAGERVHVPSQPRGAVAVWVRTGAGRTRLRARNAVTARQGWLAVRRRHESDRRLGVFGVREGAGFLIAWEIMGFGGAVMILSEKLAPQAGRPVLFMLGLLEVGAVALLVAVLLLAVPAHSFGFETFGAAAGRLAFQRWPRSAYCW